MFKLLYVLKEAALGGLVGLIIFAPFIASALGKV